MKKQTPYWKMSACLAAAALTFLGTASAIQAATALTGYLTIRPLTPTEISDYHLTNPPAQFSAGLNNVGLGEPVYLDALVNNSLSTASISNVTWTLVSQPAGSTAVLLTSPLGTNVPVYYPADQLIYQVAGRAMLRPDVSGSYTVNAIIGATGSGSTNITLNITAGTYVGAQTCAACHSGGFVYNGTAVPSIYPTYTNTPHASFFAKAIDGLESSHYNANCIECHTVGYDTNSFAVNGGFDDMAKLLGWSFPSVLTNGNWAAMPSALQNLANIQCENCHGPGSQHVYGGGATNLIAVSYAAGDCSQCHDDLNNHFKSAEWNNSMHAITTTHPAGNASCVGCHTAPGFIGRIDGWSYTNTAYEAITCQACHAPHSYDATTNPHELRVSLTNSVVFNDGTVVTNAGAGLLCMECHHARVNAATYASDPNNASAYFGPHHGPQGDMLEGVNGYTYGQNIPSSAHAKAVPDTCATCHMQNIGAKDPAFLQAGGHTFKMSYMNGSNQVDLVAACQSCHGPSITSFDFPLQDYDGDGVVEGVQTEVQHLMDKLSTLLPNSSGVIDGLVKVPSPAKTWTAPQVEAAYNYSFVQNDGSMGIHNTAYTVGLLKASIANLTGDANNDGLPDAWQIQYFGSTTNAAAAPNAINNASGMPNWMMYALGLAPTASFTVDGSGTVFFNGNNIVNGATNTIAIYTAAEIAFNTQVGTSYQIQGISSLSGTWSDISTNIPGTGGTISYVVPTRNDAQMFFRVVHTP